jgi:hypothetical protein
MDTQTIDTIDSFLTELSRKELQALAKQHEIKANLKVRPRTLGLLRCKGVALVYTYMTKFFLYSSLCPTLFYSLPTLSLS